MSSDLENEEAQWLPRMTSIIQTSMRMTSTNIGMFTLPKMLPAEAWNSTVSGWIHYMIHSPERHILLFRRPKPKADKPSSQMAASRSTAVSH
uniref:Cyclin-dependent kinases regulatory subunit n=1 Tax=Ditylenchus dipsaci TaxID=166011 RepID=A0A915D220_9BILA